jgi:hypothetical protein
MTCVIKRILTIQIPIKYKKVVVLDNNNNDITASCQYSWSSDNLCWTSWTTYNEYQRITPNIDSDFYLRILLFGGFSKVALDNSFIDCYDLSLYSENNYLQDLCETSNFDIYSKLDCALLFQQQLSDLICCMIGVPCYYFRVLPQEYTSDYSFKEYVLHNVSEVKYIKLVLQDGALPSSLPQMTEFDFDWDNDWEVEIGKSMFANAFGDKAFPKQRDMIYVPMMNRMYEVNSAYDEKQEMLMWRATTWKLGLVKWTDKSNVDKNTFEDTINSLIDNSFERDFFDIENNEQEKESGILQTESPNFNPTNIMDITISDYIRKTIPTSERVHITEKRINHGSVIVTRNFYEFTDLASYIAYQKKYCGDSGELMFIIAASNQLEKLLFKIGNIRVYITSANQEKDNYIGFGSLQCKLDKGVFYSVICKWDRANFTTELIVKKLSIPANVPAYKIKPEAYKFVEVYRDTAAYNNDYIGTNDDIILYNGGLKITNIKLFNKILSADEETLESIKYSTTNENCILNDVARPIEIPHGYSVK